MLVQFASWAQQNPAVDTSFGKKPFLQLNIGSAESRGLAKKLASLNEFLKTHIVQLEQGKWNTGTTITDSCSNTWQARLLKFYAKPITFPESKAGTENPPPASYVQNNFNDNRSYQLNITLERPALQPLPADPCCDEDFGESEFGAYFSLRHISGNILIEQGIQGLLGLQLVNRKLGKGPGGKIFGRPLGWKSQVEVYVSGSESTNVPCDTCGVWVPDPNGILRVGIGLGSGPIILDWRPFHEVSWLSLRFALLLRYETHVKKDESADLKGLFFEPEAEILLGKPVGIHGKFEIGERFYPFPTKPVEWNPVASTALTATVVVPFGDNDKIEERRVKKAETMAKKAEQDTIALREQVRTQFLADSIRFVSDSLLVDSLLVHGDTIEIVDSLWVSDPVPQSNFWNLKGKREARKITELNTAESDLFYYMQRFNALYKIVDEEEGNLWNLPRAELVYYFRSMKEAEKRLEEVQQKHAGKKKNEEKSAPTQ